MSDPRLTRWEYRSISWRWLAPWPDIDVELNKYGEDRWEVIWVKPDNDCVRILMKRPKMDYGYSG